MQPFEPGVPKQTLEIAVIQIVMIDRLADAVWEYEPVIFSRSGWPAQWLGWRRTNLDVDAELKAGSFRDE